jgi:hypothetical protein
MKHWAAVLHTGSCDNLLRLVRTFDDSALAEFPNCRLVSPTQHCARHFNTERMVILKDLALSNEAFV